LTNEIEDRVQRYIEQIDGMGGAVSAIEKGFMQKEITESAYRFQKEVEAKKRIIVGVNDFAGQDEVPIKTLRIDPVTEKRLVEQLEKIRENRNQVKVDEALNCLRRAADHEKESLMPLILDAVRLHASLGEICGTLREVFGEYKPLTIF
jgi:methylmalonyl-CoA mutase N-terminal domain/subunit